MEKSKVLVSIITPTYNHEKFIGQCIESVLAQSYPYWEQIIIDDGSTDNTEEIVAKYNDKRIKYIKQKNVGIYKLKETYNKALNLSKGDLIAVLEGDDFWPSYKLETQIKAFDNSEVGLCWGNAGMTDSEGNLIKTLHKDLTVFENLSKLDLLRKLLFWNFIPACTVICRKSSLLRIEGFKQPKNAPYVDYPTWLELIVNEKFLQIDEILGYWRRHEKQITTSKLLEMYEKTKFEIDFFEKLDPELKDSLGITLNELVINYEYRIASIYYYLGRKNLADHEWKEGNINFKSSFRYGGLFLKFKSLVGLFFTFCKIDLPPLED